MYLSTVKVSVTRVADGPARRAVTRARAVDDRRDKLADGREEGRTNLRFFRTKLPPRIFRR